MSFQTDAQLRGSSNGHVNYVKNIGVMFRRRRALTKAFKDRAVVCSASG